MYGVEAALDYINHNMVVLYINDDDNDDGNSNVNHNRNCNRNYNGKYRSRIGKVIEKVVIQINIGKVRIFLFVFWKR